MQLRLSHRGPESADSCLAHFLATKCLFGAMNDSTESSGYLGIEGFAWALSDVDKLHFFAFLEVMQVCCKCDATYAHSDQEGF